MVQRSVNARHAESMSASAGVHDEPATVRLLSANELRDLLGAVTAWESEGGHLAR
ncbi:MAG: hypothetical protein QOE41_4601 [Mycobacterium sp.]|jgi:hypothetical protein|nr:hypothetical protein [Mycobacterium sp.]